jgi:hypothetical protein
MERKSDGFCFASAQARARDGPVPYLYLLLRATKKVPAARNREDDAAPRRRTDRCTPFDTHSGERQLFSPKPAIVNFGSPCYCPATDGNKVVTNMDAPQFQKAEYAGTRDGDRCKVCGTALGDAYWRVGTHMTCQACAEKAKSELPKDSHSAFSRGLLFGIGGAILGLVLYAGFTIVTGIILGYVSLAVGYIVGRAIKMGSNGMTGRRYQIAAAILTYAAVSMAAIPIAVSEIVKVQHERQASHAQMVITPRDSNSRDENSTTVTSRASDMNASPAISTLPPPGSSPARSPRKLNVGMAIAGLLYVGLASPFLELAQNPISGLIGLFILAIGIRIAWQITGAAKVPLVSGPYRNTNVASPTPAPPAAPPSLG